MPSKVIDCRDSILGRTAIYVDGSEQVGQERMKRKRAIPLDLTLIVGSHQVPVQCHRLIASFHSEMLNVMLNGEMAEQKESQVTLPLEGLVCEHEVDAQTFKLWVKSIYSGQLELDEELAVKMVNLLSFLMSPALLGHCYEYMKNNVNSETIFSFLECCYRYDSKIHPKCDELKKECEAHLFTHFDEVIKSDRIQDLSKSTFIESILKRLYIDAPEITLFKAVLKWNEPRKDEDATQELLSYIRYPRISAKDLTAIVYPTKLVSQDVLFEAFRYQSILENPVEAEKMSKGDRTGKFVDRRFPESVQLSGFKLCSEHNTIYDRAGILNDRPFFKARNCVNEYLWMGEDMSWCVSLKNDMDTDFCSCHSAFENTEHPIQLGTNCTWKECDGNENWEESEVCVKAVPSNEPSLRC